MEFPPNGRSNLLVVGDSYGQDFVNALSENGLGASVNISTHMISRACGNLLPDGDFADIIAPTSRPSCSQVVRFDDERVCHLLPEADLVVLASSWQPWQAPLVDETVRNLSVLTDARVVVLGRKSLSELSFSDLLRHPLPKRLSLAAEVSDVQLEVNAIFEAELDDRDYIDFQRIVCGTADRCPVFAPDGSLISFDGGHLTRQGARFVGARLLGEAEPLQALLDASRLN